MISKASIPTHYKQNHRTIIKTNFSNFISGRIFFVFGKDQPLYPIAFFSENHNSAKCNDKIYGNDLLAIIECFE